MKEIYKKILLGTLLAQTSYLCADTQVGWDYGARLGYYQYHEPDLMKITGPIVGIYGSYTQKYDENFFWKLDSSVHGGMLDYVGSGTLNNTENLYTDLRALVIRDVVWSAQSFSPYTGLGYRFLYNDLRGITSTGATGYRRLSNYLYLPVGVNTNISNSLGKFALNLEAGLLIRGYQETWLSDVYNNISDVENVQKNGYNIRASLLYQLDNWSMGPYYNYWSIGRSKVENGWVEPKNNTAEYGLQIKFRF